MEYNDLKMIKRLSLKCNNNNPMYKDCSWSHVLPVPLT